MQELHLYYIAEKFNYKSINSDAGLNGDSSNSGFSGESILKIKSSTV